MDTQLIDADGTPVPVGTVLPDNRGGADWTVTGWQAPHHEGSSGRVHVERPCDHTPEQHVKIYWCQGTEQRAFFPHVFGIKITEVGA
jgi:hypothetical protein